MLAPLLIAEFPSRRIQVPVAAKLLVHFLQPIAIVAFIFDCIMIWGQDENGRLRCRSFLRDADLESDCGMTLENRAEGGLTSPCISIAIIFAGYRLRSRRTF